METILWITLIIVFVAVEIATVGLTAIWFAGGVACAVVRLEYVCADSSFYCSICRVNDIYKTMGIEVF